MTQDVELDMLRDFYTKWLALHGIPTTDENMQRKKEAAQALVDASRVISSFRSPVKLAS